MFLVMVSKILAKDHKINLGLNFDHADQDQSTQCMYVSAIPLNRLSCGMTDVTYYPLYHCFETKKGGSCALRNHCAYNITAALGTSF